MKLAGLVSLIAMASAPSPAQEFQITRAEVDHVRGVDFAAFPTYAWKASQDPGDDQAEHAALVFAIEDGLAERGLRRAEKAAQARLLVRYYTDFERHVRSRTTRERAIEPDNQRTSIGFSRAIRGTLVIELYRASDEERLWRGRTSENTAGQSLSEDQIRRMVKLILREYPPPAERGTSGARR
jgi:hypothetical protein